ncbi:hypothetical protein AD428_07625 [Achromobacter sp. DMS1]|nr:hypothetical protein AD428_08680 [Achromobacter sp. DMS1]KOF54351.1 hypothetical protein AD428_07625 [Achromobacter sp. DMS1]
MLSEACLKAHPFPPCAILNSQKRWVLLALRRSDLKPDITSGNASNLGQGVAYILSGDMLEVVGNENSMEFAILKRELSCRNRETLFREFLMVILRACVRLTQANSFHSVQ